MLPAEWNMIPSNSFFETFFFTPLHLIQEIEINSYYVSGPEIIQLILVLQFPPASMTVIVYSECKVSILNTHGYNINIGADQQQFVFPHGGNQRLERYVFT